ncbi:MAG: acetyl-CoA carboxylase biotin carboxyl carrier protein subunit [Anaerolineales bacterium]|nr:acetyl-CoA carboxylase biotin carboxyl carrier protein subunit [Anaerolineales bacterium]
MAEYKVAIAGRTYTVVIQKDGLYVNGEKLSYYMESLNETGLHILKQPNRFTEAYLQSDNNGIYDIQIDGNHLSAEVITGKNKKKKTIREAIGQMFSPMPGMIVDILVKEGDQVKEGDTLLIQEAMKMQMKIRTTCQGIVQKINIKAGSQVEKGVLLISIDPAVQPA